ncbi:Lsr2 family protein [Modestobacter marinus]|nr:Lsr2 family protein [Modestobacter marinus]
MATKQVVSITDDIDGREGAETVTFAYAARGTRST